MRLALALLLASSAWPADNTPVVDWVRANAIRLATPEAGHGFDDMQPLKKVIGDARIVELGEATHGTREFFQLKHRMLEFMATQMGFTIFSIEANMPEAYRLNEYVLTGKGDPKALLKGMYFWTWDTEEVLDMIQWMRQFNASGKGRVEFTGFDMQTPDVALGIVKDFARKYDEDYLATLQSAGDVAVKMKQVPQGAKFGVATGTLPIKDAAGKRARFSGYIRTKDITRGYAGLWFRVDGAPGKVLAFDNMHDRGVTGTTDWTRYEIDLPVAADARNINFGMILDGDGTAWFDGLAIQLDDQPYTPPGLDLDFERQAHGFYTGGSRYQIRADAAAVHSGKLSLRMQFMKDLPDPDAATDTWNGIVNHMNSMRESYAKKGAAAGDIEWSLQNARVVLQCMQMFAGKVTRDDSMAQNIKWILDHSPKDKLVVWAHNGHVKAGGEGYGSMGAALRQMYGDKMVVFGFAFNQGSFQAVEVQKSRHDFTVPPAPDGSLDATLAATGIPLFALDLRRIPKEGPVAEWWNQAHQTRSIGALFSDAQAANYLFNQTVQKSYDALLFVEKTTAARGNTPGGTQMPPVLESREYRDAAAGVTLSLPVGWSMRAAIPFGDHETTVPLVLAESQAMPAFYYRLLSEPRPLAPEALRAKYRSDCESKVESRLAAGRVGYHLRPDSYRNFTIGDRPAIACTAAFTMDGKEMVEYFIRVYRDNLITQFFATLPAAELERFQPRFDALAAGLKM
jgi:erythromycin esterase-like protein